MAEVSFPSGAAITAMHVEPWLPGQIALASPFTGTVQVLDRGYASWRGAADIAVVDEDGDAKAVEAFLASLEGQANFTLLPLNRPTVGASDSATVSAIVNAADGTISHQLSDALTVAAGDWLANGTRVYAVRTVAAVGQELTLDPQVPLEIGSAIGEALTIRAMRQAVRARPMRRTPDFWGPWRLDWQEAV